MKKTVIDPKQTYQNTNVDLICGQYYRNRKQYPHTGLLVEGRDVGYERYRDKYPDFPFVDKVTDVDVSLEFFETGRAEKYVPSKIESDELVVFIHGGGWWAGAVDRYRYVCKFIARTFRRITYSIDYDLAPEFVYPHQVEQISGIIDELCKDGKKIILFGDSAGGNLALAETLKQKEHPGRIKAQILYYPCVTMSDRYDKTWDIERYGETGELERSLISRLRPADGIMASYYCKEEEREDCFNSPLYMKDHSFYPKTIFCLAGLDYLRQQGEDFAQKLDEEGVDVTLFIYKGLAHGFFDRLYYFWQAEDSIQRVYEAYLNR